MMKQLFARRRAEGRWVALVPAVVAFLFSTMAIEDAGVVGALPYLAVALLCILYIVRPMMAFWALPFAAFVAYSVMVLINPLVDPGNGPLSEWVLFAGLGIVPAVLLWVARPKATDSAA